MTHTRASGDLERTRTVVGAFVQQGLLPALLVLGLITTTIAILLMWMFLTEPIEVARSVRHGSTADVARLVASAVYDLVARLAAWL